MNRKEAEILARKVVERMNEFSRGDEIVLAGASVPFWQEMKKAGYRDDEIAEMWQQAVARYWRPAEDQSGPSNG